MNNDDRQRDRLLARARRGDAGALVDLVELERPVLYDYLMRMTGQVSRSADAIDEALQNLDDGALSAAVRSTDVRMALYSGARRAVADIWNADTSRLTNLVLETPIEGGRLDENLLRERAAFKAVDRSVRCLPGPQREAVILRIRLELDLASIATLMGASEAEVDRLCLEGMQRVDAECTGLIAGPEVTVKHMPRHQVPERSGHATLNLSVVMQGIRRSKPVGLSSPFRFVAFVVTLALALSWYFYPLAWTELFALVGLTDASEPAPP